jgi:transposase
VNTISEQAVGPRRRRRTHSDDFKANAVASCMQPGMSMAAVAMAHGINANLLRRWVREAEMGRGTMTLQSQAASQASAKTSVSAFVPMQLPAPGAAPAISIELRRGATAINVSWPAEAADACAAWMRELLR